MYQLHVYESPDGYRWGVLAENGDSLANGGQGYSNKEDMETPILKMFVIARGALIGQHVPWIDCDKHNSKQGKCYVHAVVDARTLARSLQEDEHAPSPHDP